MVLVLVTKTDIRQNTKLIYFICLLKWSSLLNQLFHTIYIYNLQGGKKKIDVMLQIICQRSFFGNKVKLGKEHWSTNLQIAGQSLQLLLDSYSSLWPRGRHPISLWQALSICRYYDKLNELDDKFYMHSVCWALIVPKAIVMPVMPIICF